MKEVCARTSLSRATAAQKVEYIYIYSFRGLNSEKKAGQVAADIVAKPFCLAEALSTPCPHLPPSPQAEAKWVIGAMAMSGARATSAATQVSTSGASGAGSK